MKRKTALAALFAGIALSQGAAAQDRPRPDPETAKILQSVGMTYAEAQRVSGGKNVAVYYDDDNAAGEAFASSGDKSCTISWSAQGEGLSSGFSADETRAMGLRYDHAIDKDIEKISMYHELSHCTQPFGMKDKEFDADQKALHRYLDQGGNRDTAQYWIYWRGLSGLLNMKRYASSDNLTPTVGLRLQAAFFGGDAPDAGKTRAAYDEVLDAMQGYGPKATPAMVAHMLVDEKLQLSPDARKLLGFYADGFRYLAEGPRKTVQPKAARTPGP